VQNFQPLRPEFNVEKADTSDITARPVKAVYEASFDGVLTSCEDDRYRRRRRLGRSYRTTRVDHRRLSMHKLGRHYRQPVVLIFSPPILDCNVLALNEASLLKAPPKCDHERRERSVRSAVKYSNQRAWLLRARRERPRSRRAAQKRDELASLQ
jgi:hypothetical protein